MEIKLEFYNTKSKYFNEAIERAKCFNVFEWKVEADQVKYRVITTEMSLKNTYKLTLLVSSWQGSKIFINDNRVDFNNALRMMTCFIKTRFFCETKRKDICTYCPVTQEINDYQRNSVLYEMEKELSLLIQKIEGASAS